MRSRLLLIDHLHDDANGSGPHRRVVRVMVVVVVVMVVHVVVVKCVLLLLRGSHLR